MAGEILRPKQLIVPNQTITAATLNNEQGHLALNAASKVLVFITATGATAEALETT